MVAAVHSEPIATPARTVTSGVARFRCEMNNMTPVARRQDKKATNVVVKGLSMTYGLIELFCITPEPRMIIEKAAPNAAAWAIPKVNGEARGFLKIDCMARPAQPRPAPATIAVRAWGRRILMIIFVHFGETDSPISV